MQITDRSKDVIKSGGEWISSIDLENIAMAHPAVHEAAVHRRARIPKWDERPLLVVVKKPGRERHARGAARLLRRQDRQVADPRRRRLRRRAAAHGATGKILKTRSCASSSRTTACRPPEPAASACRLACDRPLRGSPSPSHAHASHVPLRAIRCSSTPGRAMTPIDHRSRRARRAATGTASSLRRRARRAEGRDGQDRLDRPAVGPDGAGRAEPAEELRSSSPSSFSAQQPGGREVRGRRLRQQGARRRKA